MVPLAAVDFGRWFGLSEAQNALAEDLAKNLWVKYKPLRKLVRFVCRVGNAHKVMILGGSAAGAAMWVRGAAQEALMERFEAKREEMARKKRLKEARRAFTGPLKEAASDTIRLISALLAPIGHDFINEFYQDKPEMSLFCTIYMLCRVGYHRRRLWDHTKYEYVTHEDSWQWVMDRMLHALDFAIMSKEASVAQYVRLYRWVPHSTSEARHDHLKSCITCPILRESIDICFPKKYPLRMSGLDRDILSHIMERNPGALRPDGEGPACISYMEFAREMKGALAALLAKDSAHPWASYMLPVWADFVCFTSLQIRLGTKCSTMKRAEILQAMQIRVKLRAFKAMLETILQVLSLPVDAWSVSFHRMQRLMFWRRKDPKLAIIIPERFMRLLTPTSQRDLTVLSHNDQAEWESYVRLRCRSAVLWEIIRTATWCRCFSKISVA